MQHKRIIMKKNLAWFVLAACLLMPPLAGWLIPRPSSGSHGANSPGQAAPIQAHIGEPSVQESAFYPSSLNGLPRESSPKFQTEPPKPRPETQQAGAELALTSSNSPINSLDLDQNRDWARNFPAAALAWAQYAPNGPQRDTIADIVCPQLAQTNPVAAVVLAENCLDSATNDVVNNLLENLAQTWAEQDQQDAYAWASATPPSDVRDRLLERVAIVQAKTNPYQAAKSVVEQLSPGEIQNEAAISVLYQWSQQDAAAALAWAQTFPAGDFRDRAIKEVKNVTAITSGTQPAD